MRVEALISLQIFLEGGPLAVSRGTAWEASVPFLDDGYCKESGPPEQIDL